MPQPDVDPRPLYDSRTDGPQYRVVTRLNGKQVYSEDVDCPLLRTGIVLGRRDLLRALLRGRLEIETLINTDNHELSETILALDGNWFTPKRRRLWNKELNAKLGEWSGGQSDEG